MKSTKKSPEHRVRIEPRSLSNRSRITNALGLLPSVDGRSTWARRMHDLLYLHLSDLGGEDNCSEAEKALARRAACLIVELEHMEMRFAMAEHGADPDELKTYQMCTNTMRRCLESLGLKRRAKTIGPTLGELLQRDHQRQLIEAD